MKATLWSSLRSGYTPAPDFHIPTATETLEEGAKAIKEREQWKNKEAVPTEGGNDDDDDCIQVIINHKSMVIHKGDAKDPQMSACCYARSKQAHYESAKEPVKSLTRYIRCLSPACFGRPENGQAPTWDTGKSEAASSESENTHAVASTCGGTSASSSSS